MSSLPAYAAEAAQRIGENPVDRSGLAVVIGLCVAAAGFGVAVLVVRRGRERTRRERG